MDTSRRTFIGAAAVLSAGVAILEPSLALAQDVVDEIANTRRHFQSWQPLDRPDVLFIQEHWPNTTRAPQVVGVSIHGGPIQYVDDAFAKAHNDAIWHCAIVETHRVRAEHEARIADACAISRAYGVEPNEAAIRNHHQRITTARLTDYHASVRAAMEAHAKRVGPSHPTLARALHSQLRNA